MRKSCQEDSVRAEALGEDNRPLVATVRVDEKAKVRSGKSIQFAIKRNACSPIRDISHLNLVVNKSDRSAKGREEQLARMEFSVRDSEAPGSAALYSRKSLFRQMSTSPNALSDRIVVDDGHPPSLQSRNTTRKQQIVR